MSAIANKVGSQRENAAFSSGRIGIKEYVLVLFQLGVVFLLLRQFQIESAAFLRLALLAFGGFAIHALLPLRHRLPFFLLLSFIGMATTLGIANGASLITIGLILIGICHLPVSFRLRGILILAVVAILVAWRAKWIDGPVADAVWPILGSMFMFRLIVYIY